MEIAIVVAILVMALVLEADRTPAIRTIDVRRRRHW
jgi:hypothetical protein